MAAATGNGRSGLDDSFVLNRGPFFSSPKSNQTEVSGSLALWSPPTFAAAVNSPDSPPLWRSEKQAQDSNIPRTKQDLYKLYETMHSSQDLSMRDLVERTNSYRKPIGNRGPLQKLEESREQQKKEVMSLLDVMKIKAEKTMQGTGRVQESSVFELEPSSPRHRVSPRVTPLSRGAKSPRRSSGASPRRSPCASPRRSPLRSPERLSSPENSTRAPQSSFSPPSEASPGEISLHPPVSPVYPESLARTSSADSGSKHLLSEGSASTPGALQVHPTNNCSSCSSYTLFFKTRCLVCGRLYCSNCVKNAMGQMPEGRKCRTTCIGRPFDRKYIAKAGRGCWPFGISAEAKEAELRWARRRSVPRTNVRHV